MNLPIRNRVTEVEDQLWFPGGKGEGEGKNGRFELTHTTMYKTDN